MLYTTFYGENVLVDIWSVYFKRDIWSILFNMQYFEKGHLSFRQSKKFFFVFHGG